MSLQKLFLRQSDDTELANYFRLAHWVIFVVLLIIGTPLLLNQSYPQALALAISAGLVWVALWLSHKSDLRKAGYLTLINLILMADAMMFFGDGIHDVALLVFPVVILVAGLLQDRNQFFTVAGLMFLSLMLISIGQMSGLIDTHHDIFDLFFDLGVITLTLGTSGYLIFMLANLMAETLVSAQLKEQQLAQQEQRYRLISTASSDYMFSAEVAADGTIHQHWVAGAFEKITGYTAAEFNAQGGWPAILHPEDFEQDKQDMAKLEQNEQVITEVRILHKDQQIRWVRIYAHPAWEQKENRLIGIFGAVQDINESKLSALRERERLQLLEKVIELGKRVTQITDLEKCFRTIHQSIQSGMNFDRVGIFVHLKETGLIQGVFGTDRQGRIEKTDWFTQKDADFPAWNELRQDPTSVLFLDDYANEMQPAQTSEMFGVKQHLSLAAWAGDALVAIITVDNLISGQPISEARINALQLFAGYAGLAIQNAQLNNELEQRVARRTADLETANQELESFNYTMAHDLRTPARAMIGFSRLLHDSSQAKLDSESLHYLDHIMTGSLRMGLMIDELLDFFHLGRAELNKKEIDTNAVATAIIGKFQEQIAERQIEIVHHDLPGCLADPIMIRKVFSHLFENAVKFTRPRAAPKIEIGADQQAGQTVYFVRDNGVGFDMKYAGKLFGVFQRLHLIDEFEGVGVGLAVVDRILRRHGGQIWVEAELDQGATFHFTVGTDKT